MNRTPVNPWSWSLRFGYNQAEILEGTKRQLVCAGQTAVDAEGNPQHLGHMRNQITLALDNLEAVLGAAAMGALRCHTPQCLRHGCGQSRRTLRCARGPIRSSRCLSPDDPDRRHSASHPRTHVRD